MNIKLESSPYTVIKALKTDKKEIFRFYKFQHYSASFIGQDQCYIVKVDNNIIASAIISAGQEGGDFWLLHALVIEKSMRGNKLASLIIQTIVGDKFNSDSFKKLICFADEELQELYIKNNFIKYNEINQLARLPDEFQQRLVSYQKKNNNLCCYLLSTNNSAH